MKEFLNIFGEWLEYDYYRPLEKFEQPDKSSLGIGRTIRINKKVERLEKESHFYNSPTTEQFNPPHPATESR